MFISSLYAKGVLHAYVYRCMYVCCGGLWGGGGGKLGIYVRVCVYVGAILYTTWVYI